MKNYAKQKATSIFSKSALVILSGFIVLVASFVLQTRAVSAAPADVPPECSSQVVDEKARCSVAQECEGGDISSSNCGITRYLILLINVLSGLVGVTVVGVMIFAGIQYSVSSGDPSAAAAAKKRISNAVLALVLFATMYGFLQWIVPGGVL